MYYNGKRGKSVSTFMKEVHTKMKVKYQDKNIEAQKQAQELQLFFQELKMAARYGINSQNFVNSMIIAEVLQQIPNHMQGKFKIENLFRGTGTSYYQGDRFERELTSVIASVLESVSEDSSSVSKSKILIGSETGKTTADDEVDNLAEELLKTTGKSIEKVLGKEAQTQFLKHQKSVQAKIDVRGYEVKVKATATPEMLHIYDLLKQATFSAKSYSSMTWDQKIKTISDITLGKTHYYRAFSGPLSDLGYGKATVASAIFAGKAKVQNGDREVAKHFFHLRYIYELTGSGIIYNNGQDYGEVKFLIYNDPSTDGIYVKSTSGILQDILNDDSDFGGDPFNATSHISKMSFLD